MGLAASQARFLGLTARKSNIEYEGQQVNQQRTALAEEVNALYNSLASLSLPIAPDATQFYKSNYSFALENGDYIVKNYYANADGTSTINTVRTYEKNVAAGTSVKANTIGKDGDNYTYTPVGGTKTTLERVTDENQRKNMIALINETYGANTVKENDELYTFVDTTNNITCYFAKSQLDSGKDPSYYTSTSKTVSEPCVISDAVITYDSNHRMSKLSFTDPATGTKKNVDVDTTRSYDSDGYDSALRDYTMSKDEYNRKVQELNAKTESLQQEDKILEMRLDQISTEQNELKTELEAVKSVLKDNIENTFNTFS